MKSNQENKQKFMKYNNKKSDKAVKIPIDGLIKKDEVLDFIKMRISEIESEIEEL